MRTTEHRLNGTIGVQAAAGPHGSVQMHDARGKDARKESAACFGYKPQQQILCWAARAKRLNGCSPA